MSDLKMKLNTNNVIRLKVNVAEPISMKFDDYQKFKEEDPIFTNSPAFKITNSDIYNWNHKSDFDGNYDSLTNKPNLTIYATRTWVTEGISNKVDKETGMGLSQNSFTTEEKNKLASLENYDDSEIVAELATKADISSIPTKLSDLDNDEGFITKDVDDLTNYPTNDSVNAVLGEKQNIIDSENLLSADLVDDTSSTNKFVTASDITAWNNKSDFSGDYNDLTNKPTIPTLTSQLTNDSGFITNANIPSKTSDLQNDSGFITNTVNDLTNYTLSSALASVATSGSYTDLINTPSIPTKTSDLNNDSGFITNSVNNLTNYTLSSSLSTVATSGSYNDLSNKPTIPTKTSELTNDSGFVTNTYSSSEVAIGKWIDNKTIYRKVYNGTTDTSDVQINLSSLNIAQIINIYGCAGSNGNFNSIPFVLVSGSTTYFISARIAYNILYLSNSSAYANKPFYLVIEYTKSS